MEKEMQNLLFFHVSYKQDTTNASNHLFVLFGSVRVIGEFLFSSRAL